VVISLRMIERPSGPTAARTVISFVPGGKLTTSVLGSVPRSTLRVVGVELVWTCGLTSGLAIFGSTLEGEAVSGEGGTNGTTRAIGTPMKKTYTATNAPTRRRP